MESLNPFSRFLCYHQKHSLCDLNDEQRTKMCNDLAKAYNNGKDNFSFKIACKHEKVYYFMQGLYDLLKKYPIGELFYSVDEADEDFDPVKDYIEYHEYSENSDLSIYSQRTKPIIQLRIKFYCF